jgi:GNAT superfamily N-acetyltransferase
MRRGATDDLSALLALQRAAYARNGEITGRTPIPLTWDYAAALRDWECWLVDGPGRLDGALLLHPRDADLYVESISVHPDAQASGLGRRLLAFADERARELGRGTLRLLTNAKLARNVDWYLAKGYVIERIERLPGRDIAHFRRDLGGTA